MSTMLKRLRNRAAAAGTGCTSISIEELNVVNAEVNADIERLRKLLREAVDWHWVRPRDGWIDDAMWAIREGGAE